MLFLPAPYPNIVTAGLAIFLNLLDIEPSSFILGNTFLILSNISTVIVLSVGIFLPLNKLLLSISLSLAADWYISNLPAALRSGTVVSIVLLVFSSNKNIPVLLPISSTILVLPALAFLIP